LATPFVFGATLEELEENFLIHFVYKGCKREF
jgi:hypothetical protein